MKFEKTTTRFIFALVLLVGFLSSQIGITGLPPTTLQGIWSAVKQTTFNFFVPNNLATKVTGGTLIELGNKNILSNPSFEHQTTSTGWTSSAGTVAEELTNVIDGKKSLKITLSSQALELYQDSTLYASQFSGSTQGLVAVRVKTSVSGIKICSRQAGATSTSLCLDVQASNEWGLYKIPFVLGSTSNGISIHSNAVSVTGDVYIDDAFVGPQSLTTEVPTCDGSLECETEFTANVSATGVVSGENLDWINGDATISDTSLYALTWNSGVFTEAPNCTFGKPDAVTYGANALPTGNNTPSATGYTIRNLRQPDGAKVAGPFTIHCSKKGTDYQRAKATSPGFSTGSAPSYYRIDTANGYGSTNTKIRRFSNVREEKQSAFTCSDSATLGFSCVIREDGIYSISYTENLSAAGYVGISKNSSELTTDIGSINAADRIGLAYVTASNLDQTASTGDVYLQSGDIIRPHTSGTTSGGAPARARFSIGKVGAVIIGSLKEVPITPSFNDGRFCGATVSNTGVISNEWGDCFNGDFSDGSGTGSYSVTFNSVFSTFAECGATRKRTDSHGDIRTVNVTTSGATVESPSATPFSVWCWGK